ncbi:hypothetical protein LZ32DRAFT_399277 [Colletotrichum eremochloae]|nr:hypothetical protein LZ32DRAFT_399277 [Colletotrichum eremochloae]
MGPAGSEDDESWPAWGSECDALIRVTLSCTRSSEPPPRHAIGSRLSPNPKSSYCNGRDGKTRARLTGIKDCRTQNPILLAPKASE